MSRKATVIVLDSFGIGALPDADRFGDVGSDTMGNIYKACGLSLPNLAKLGLASIDGVSIDVKKHMDECAIGAYGRIAEKSNGKDTVTGHWEMMGIVSNKGFSTYPNGFPNELISRLVSDCGRDVIGNCVASGTEIISKLGKEHVNTGAIIVYTSADSVLQIAAHEDVVPLEELYEICKTARKIIDENDFGVCRVIARPFTGNEIDGFSRTENRRDYAVEPTGKTVLDELVADGYTTCAIGKIEDIFSNRGISIADHTKNNESGIDATIKHMQNDDIDFVFTNLVDFDSLFGHRNNPTGYRDALQYFDSRLPDLLQCLKNDDLLIITADHGCDPTTVSTDHSREYVPLLVYSNSMKCGKNLGTLSSFTVVGIIVKAYIESSICLYDILDSLE